MGGVSRFATRRQRGWDSAVAQARAHPARTRRTIALSGFLACAMGVGFVIAVVSGDWTSAFISGVGVVLYGCTPFSAFRGCGG